MDATQDADMSSPVFLALFDEIVTHMDSLNKIVSPTNLTLRPLVV